MLELFLALIFTAVMMIVLSALFKIRKGITLKFGSAGIVLILMPQFLAIVQNPSDRMFNIAILVGAVAGIFLLMMDIPGKET